MRLKRRQMTLNYQKGINKECVISLLLLSELSIFVSVMYYIYTPSQKFQQHLKSIKDIAAR